MNETPTRRQDELPTHAEEAIDVGRLHASSDTEVDEARERLRPTPVHVPATWQEAAAECERSIQELANALLGEVLHRAQIAEARESLTLIEYRCTLSPAVQDQKNEAARKAHAQVLFAEDGLAQAQRSALARAERELAAVQAEVEVHRERIKLHRALLAVFAKGAE